MAVFAVSFISSMGLPVGSEAAIIYGGVLASGQIPNEPHHLNVVVVIAVAVAAEVLGSLVGYFIGDKGGRPLVDRVGKYVLLDAQGPRPGRGLVDPSAASRWSSSAASSPCCAPSCRSPPASPRWRSASSWSSP